MNINSERIGLDEKIHPINNPQISINQSTFDEYYLNFE